MERPPAQPIPKELLDVDWEPSRGRASARRCTAQGWDCLLAGACPSPPGPMRPCPHKLQIKAHLSLHLLLIDGKGRAPCVCFYGQIPLSFFLPCSPTPRKKKKSIHLVLWKKRMPTDGRFFAECCGKVTEPLMKLAMWSGDTYKRWSEYSVRDVVMPPWTLPVSRQPACQPGQIPTPLINSLCLEWPSR